MDFSFPWFSETGGPDRQLGTDLSFFLLSSFLLLTNSDMRFNLAALRTLATSQDHTAGNSHSTTNFNVFKDFMNGFLRLLFQSTQVINLITNSLGNRSRQAFFSHLFLTKLEFLLTELLFRLAHFMASFLPSLVLLLQNLKLLLLLRLQDQLHLLVNLLALLLLFQMLLLLILLFNIAFFNSLDVRLLSLLLQFFFAGRDSFGRITLANSFNLLLNIFRVSSHLDLRTPAFLRSQTHAQEEINFLDFRASGVIVDSHGSSLVA